MENLKVMVVVSAVVMGWLSLVVLGSPVLHKVGGSKGWNNNQQVNYTQWASQEHVYVGDWLIFNFDKRYFNVLEVNKTSYENCIDRDFIKNITRGGRDVVEMTEARTYYYISGGGYCFHGMKVAVQVRQYPSPASASASAPAPATIPSSRGHCFHGFGIIVANVVVFVNLILI